MPTPQTPASAVEQFLQHSGHGLRLMISGLHFLIVAKHCEIAQLEALADTSALVDTTGQLVHALQRERGLSSLYLASRADAAHAAWLAQVHNALQLEDALRASYENLHTPRGEPGHGARLFNRMAYAVQGLDALPLLRDQVAASRWSAAHCTAAYVKLIAGLLAVVFEAADSAADPDVSRLLVVLFNLMQGKELAGQERATGSAMLASGVACPTAQQRWLNLIDAQERCFQVCRQFATHTPELDLSAARMAPGPDIERLRRVGTTALANSALDTALSPRWFEGCTQRMDALRTCEVHVTDRLTALCHERVATARAELGPWARLQSQSLRHILADVAPITQLGSPPGASGFFDEPTPDVPRSMPDTTRAGLAHAPLLDQSILELVHAQTQRLQDMAIELEGVRASLGERKLIERAKGLLMARQALTEEGAYQLLRQTAMNQGRRIPDVAQALLSLADVLPPR